MCDNTDCPNFGDKEFYIVLRKEFDSGLCKWCRDCIRRDEAMIRFVIRNEHIAEHFIKLLEIKDKYLDHINTMCAIILNMAEKSSAWFMCTDNLEALKCNVEIIQEIIKKVKNNG